MTDSKNDSGLNNKTVLKVILFIVGIVLVLIASHVIKI